MKGVSAEEVIEVGKRHYQLFADPVKDGAQLKGIILLILDVTEKKKPNRIGGNLRQTFLMNLKLL